MVFVCSCRHKRGSRFRVRRPERIILCLAEFIRCVTLDTFDGPCYAARVTTRGIITVRHYRRFLAALLRLARQTGRIGSYVLTVAWLLENVGYEHLLHPVIVDFQHGYQLRLPGWSGAADPGGEPDHGTGDGNITDSDAVGPAA